MRVKTEDLKRIKARMEKKNLTPRESRILNMINEALEYQDKKQRAK